MCTKLKTDSFRAFLKIVNVCHWRLRRCLGEGCAGLILRPPGGHSFELQKEGVPLCSGPRLTPVHCNHFPQNFQKLAPVFLTNLTKFAVLFLGPENGQDSGSAFNNYKRKGVHFPGPKQGPPSSIFLRGKTATIFTNFNSCCDCFGVHIRDRGLLNYRTPHF